MLFRAQYMHFVGLIPVLAASVSYADQPASLAAVPVQALSTALIDAMKLGSHTNFSERAERLTPVVDRAFDLPLTTRLIVGQKWSSVSTSDQSALLAAVRKMTIAEYAKNFSHWSGEAIVVDPKVELRGGDALVRSTLTRPKGEPVVLAYRLRSTGGQWRIIDVFFNGTISQLATRRADYAHILDTSGARALTEHINELAAKAAR
jgi:phospholipid transport system substrate-binding protein